MADDDRELEPAEVAKILGVSTSTVRRYGDRGLLRPRRLLGSKHRRYEASSVHELKAINDLPDGLERQAAYEAVRRRNLGPDDGEVLTGPAAEEFFRDLLLSLSPEGLAKVRDLINQALTDMGEPPV